MKHEVNRNAGHYWKYLADDLGLSLIRVKPRGKEPNEGKGWHKLEHRPYADIGFEDGDNAGILTNDIIVLDVDNPELFNRIVPETFTVQTGKGYHYYFIRPDNADYRCRSVKAEGFDVRANGGYVVAPGSVHPNGSEYISIYDRPMVDAPDWLLELSLKVDTPGQHRLPSSDPFVIKTLDADTNRLLEEGVPEGQRSEAIFKVINKMIEAGRQHP
jgi:hypothetical protein